VSVTDDPGERPLSVFETQVAEIARLEAETSDLQRMIKAAREGAQAALRERDAALTELERLHERMQRLEVEVTQYRAGQQTLAGLAGGDSWR